VRGKYEELTGNLAPKNALWCRTDEWGYKGRFGGYSGECIIRLNGELGVPGTRSIVGSHGS